MAVSSHGKEIAKLEVKTDHLEKSFKELNQKIEKIEEKFDLRYNELKKIIYKNNDTLKMAITPQKIIKWVAIATSIMVSAQLGLFKIIGKLMAGGFGNG